jgi:hypothetical protein
MPLARANMQVAFSNLKSMFSVGIIFNYGYRRPRSLYTLFELSAGIFLDGYRRPWSFYTLFELSAGIFEQSMGARNRVGIGLSYRPAMLHKLAGSIPSRNRVVVPARQAT